MQQQTLVNLTSLACCGIGIATALGTRPWKGESKNRLACLPAIGVAVAFGVAMFTLVGDDLQLFWPKSSVHWLFWIAVICVIVAIVEAIFGLKKIVMTLIGVAVIVGGLMLIGEGKLHTGRTAWSYSDASQWIALSGLIALMNVIASNLVATRLSARPVLAAWTLAIGLSAAVVGLLGKSERLANLMLMLASSAAGIGLVAMIFKKYQLNAAVCLTLSVLSAGIVSAAMDAWYAYLPLPYAILVLAAPIACLAAFLADRQRTWTQIAVVIIAVMAILAWPLGKAYETYESYRAMGFALVD